MPHVRDATALDRAGERLVRARATCVPCAPVRDLIGRDDISAAYTVQRAWVTARIAAGARVVGRKIGLTHPAVQAQLGVDQPDFGTLLDDMRCGTHEPIDPARLLQPKIEAEIAFTLASDLTQPEIGPDDVAEATSSMVPALEIVDSRIANWDIAITDTVADNASAGLFVLGDEPLALGGIDLVGCEMVLRRQKEVVSTGSGGQCLGNPLNAVAWLARTAAAFGHHLLAGDIVLSGALGPMVTVSPGDEYEATITGLGSVHASFAQARA